MAKGQWPLVQPVKPLTYRHPSCIGNFVVDNKFHRCVRNIKQHKPSRGQLPVYPPSPIIPIVPTVSCCKIVRHPYVLQNVASQLFPNAPLHIHLLQKKRAKDKTRRSWRPLSVSNGEGWPRVCSAAWIRPIRGQKNVQHSVRPPQGIHFSWSNHYVALSRR